MADAAVYSAYLAPPARRTRAELRAILGWHLGFAVGAVMAAIVAAASPAGSVSVVVALLAAAAAGLAGLRLAKREGEGQRLRLALIWTLAIAVACLLSGGLVGPFAALCLAPLAVSVMMGAPGGIAAGAGLSLFAAAVAAFGQLVRLTPSAPDQSLAAPLTLAALLAVCLGLAVSLRLAQRRAERAATLAAPASPELERLLDAQPYLMLSLDQAGVVQARFGELPPGLPRPSVGESLANFAALPARLDLQAAIGAATRDGRAQADFAPLDSPDRICAITLRRTPEGVLAAVIRDASRERWREAELDAARGEAEALNAGKSRFLVGMSHELRTPLNAIMGFSDVMRAKLFGDLPPRYAEYAEMIHESGRHLLDLINDLLDMSKIEAERYQLSREVFDAKDAVNAALRLVRMQADTAGISLRGVLPAAPLEVDADARALKQIVLNLVSNALKFTPRGGSVTVTLAAEGPDLQLRVTDTGIGIAKADLARLGRPYEQAGDADQRARGTGLGLSLVRALAELHGGAMTIESELGEGTSVTVRLPVRPDPAASGPTRTAEIIPFTVERR